MLYLMIYNLDGIMKDNTTFIPGAVLSSVTFELAVGRQPEKLGWTKIFLTTPFESVKNHFVVLLIYFFGKASFSSSIFVKRAFLQERKSKLISLTTIPPPQIQKKIHPISRNKNIGFWETGVNRATLVHPLGCNLISLRCRDMHLMSI